MNLNGELYQFVKKNIVRRSAGRILLFTALILLLPLLAMQITDELVWNLTDFCVAGGLLISTGIIYELAARKMINIPYRSALGVALAAVLLLIWINLAVGIIGSEVNSANLMYGGVLAIGFIGAIIARFQPRGMARALIVTALAQALVAVIALIARLGTTGPIWPWDILTLTGFFIMLWIVSAWLFQKAARLQTVAQTNS